MARGSRRGAFRGKVSHNATQQRSRAANYGHLTLPRGVNVFKEEPGGRIAIDVLPYFVTSAAHPDRDEEREIAVEGTLWYRCPYKLHRSVGTEKESVVCPTSFGRKCPICDYRSKRLDEGADWKSNEIRAMRASERNLYYIVPKGSSKHEEKPYIWDISQFCFQDALNNELEENEEWGDFPDLDNGLTLRIRFTEEKIERNSFAKTSRIDFEQRGYTYDEDTVRELTSLDECLDVKDYREVERMFFETGSDGVDDGDEDPPADDGDRSPPARPLTKPKAAAPTETRTVLARQRRPAVEEDPEDGDDDAPFDEGDSDPESTRSVYRPPAPARRSASDEDGRAASAALDRAVEERRAYPAAAAAKSAKSSKPSPARAAPEVEERRAATPTRSQPKAAASGNGKCPSGYEFGVDVDKKPECEECPVWGDCYDAAEEVRK